jgi:hypothetical protein
VIEKNGNKQIYGFSIGVLGVVFVILVANLRSSRADTTSAYPTFAPEPECRTVAKYVHEIAKLNRERGARRAQYDPSGEWFRAEQHNPNIDPKYWDERKIIGYSKTNLSVVYETKSCADSGATDPEFRIDVVRVGAGHCVRYVFGVDEIKEARVPCSI